MLQNIIDRIRLPFRKDKELISALYDIIGFYPHKVAYYKLALMHKSLGHRSTAEDLIDDEKSKKYGKKSDKSKFKGKDNKKGLGRKLNNERLEFLGDAILDAIVGDIVYHQYPGKPEGFLTNTRSKLVQRETLGKLAQQMGLSKLILSSGRSASHNSYMGGNAFEALFGAIYLDRGYDACYKFWEERILGRYLNIDKVAYKEVNFKSKLIEWSQKNRIKMEFRLEEQTKDSNGSPMFSYTVVLETIDGENGTGYSKKESQQHASEKTLRKLKSDHAFLDSIFAAKTERTKMDEDMIQVVPDAERPDNLEGLVIENPEMQQNEAPERQTYEEENNADITLDDVNVEYKEPSREDIIAAAEAAAFAETEK